MRRLALLSLLVGVLCLSAGIAGAHGYIVRSIPADRAVLERSPNQVQVWFSEGLEREFSTIAVYNQGGALIGEGGVDAQNTGKLVAPLPPNLPAGAYLVRMRPVFASDGHAVSDTMVFWVGEQVGGFEVGGASQSAIPLEVVWRAILTLALTTLAGAYWMNALVLRPAWGAGRQLPPAVMRRLRLMVWVALITALIVNVLALLQISMNVFEASVNTVIADSLWEITLQGTNFGDVWVWRSAVLVAMLAIQIVAAQQTRNRPQAASLLWLVNGLFALAALLTLSLISHAAGSPRWPGWSVLVGYLHLLAVAAWIGGVIVLVLVLRPMLTPLSPQERGEALRAALRRFSPLALVAVSLIIATGFYAAANTVPRPDDLTSSDYGLTLIAKWILMLPLLGLGGLHFLLVSPERFPRLHSRVSRMFSHLPQTLPLEMLFALAVMLAATALPATPPPPPPDARAQVTAETLTQDVQGYEVSLAVQPGAIGANSFDVTIRQNGQPAEIESVRLRLSYPAAGLYTAPLTLEESEPGVWIGASGDVRQAAEWQALIDFRPAGGGTETATPPLRAVFAWEIVAEVEDTASQPGLLNWLAALSVIGVLSVWIAPRGVAFARATDWTPSTLLIGGIGVGAFAALLAAGFVFFETRGQQIDERRNPPPDVINPVVADESSLAQGREIYYQTCFICHGAGGEAQMPAATLIERPVPSLTLALAGQTDEDIADLLEGGLVRRHPYGQELSSEARWHLINFLRSLE